MTASRIKIWSAMSLAFWAAAGVFLRIFNWSEWPPGPWVDEAFALRAARIARAVGAPLFGTSPLTPLEAGFVNSYSSNIYLFVTSWVDQLCGGGLLSLRVLSIGPSLFLFAFAILLAREVLSSKRAAFLASVAVLSTSMWLLTTGRWGWNAVSTAALVTASAWMLLVAIRRESVACSLVSGLLLGLAQYGYVAAWMAFGVPLLAAGLLRTGAPAGRARGRWLFPAQAFLMALLVALPYFLHLAWNRDRAVARTSEISILRFGASELPHLAGKNIVRHAGLFLWGGDPNERHGDPGSPVLPPLAAGLALVGFAAAVRKDGPPRLAALYALAFLLGGFLSYEADGPNSYRISPAAPFLIVLAGTGFDVLVATLPEKHRRVGVTVLAALVIFAATGDAVRFLRWATADRAYGVFGGPERDLADALERVSRTDPDVDFAVEPVAVRNPLVTDTLVAKPGTGGVPALRMVFPGSPFVWRFLPKRRQLLVLANEPSRAAFASALGAQPLLRGGRLEGFPGWVVYGLSASSAQAAARGLESLPVLGAQRSGNFPVEERGLFEFHLRGAGEAHLDGKTLFRGSSSSAVFVILDAGPHRLVFGPLQRDARLTIRGPDGFARALP